MEQAAAGTLSEQRIRFSANIRISTTGAVDVSYDVTTPERKSEAPIAIAPIPGIELVAPQMDKFKRRGGWPRGKKRSKKAAKRKR